MSGLLLMLRAIRYMEDCGNIVILMIIMILIIIMMIIIMIITIIVLKAVSAPVQRESRGRHKETAPALLLGSVKIGQGGVRREDDGDDHHHPYDHDHDHDHVDCW